MLKRFICAILMLVVLFSSVQRIDADQMNESEVSNGVIFDEEEEQAYLNSLTEEEWEIIRRKEQEARDFQNYPKPRATKISLPESFYIYEQETNYYCIPAAVKSVMKYLTGSSSSQSQIAAVLGTDSSGTLVSRIAPYMNDNQDVNYYYNKRKEYLTVTNLRENVYLDIVNYEVPVFLNVTSYATGMIVDHPIENGHCMVIMSVYTDHSKFEIADPRGGSQYEKYFEAQTAIVHDVTYSIVW